MFKDQLSNQAKIFPGDMAYIYPYNKRRDIEYFSDLNYVRVADLAPKSKPTDDIMVTGFETHISKTNREDEKVFGVLEYVREGNIVKTAEGNKIINFFERDGAPERCLRKIKKEHDYCQLYCIFKLSKEIELRVNPYDLICLNQDNLCKLIELTTLKTPRLNNGYISFILNDKEVNVIDFEVWVNGIRYEGYDYANVVFKWACKNKNSLIETGFDFNKTFSLKHINYEMRKISLV